MSELQPTEVIIAVPQTVVEKHEKPPALLQKTQSIKIRLHAQTPAIRQWILDSVDVVSLISVHVSRFANLYVLYCCQNNLPLPTINNIFYNNVMYLVTNTQKDKFADQQMQMAYTQLYAGYLQNNTPLRTTDQYRFLENLSCEMTTNSSVYLKTQFITRFRNWCKDTVMSLLPIDSKDEKVVEKKQQRWKVVNYLFAQTAKSESCVIDLPTLIVEANTALLPICPLVWSDEVSAAICNAIASTRQELNSTVMWGEKSKFCRPITGAKLLSASFSPCYLRWMYKYLKSLELYNANPNNQQKKVFSMLPIRGLDRSYISISNTCLSEWIYRNRTNINAVGQEIHNKIKHLERKTEFLPEFNSNAQWYWQQCFEFQHALGKRSQFEGPISTDGYACSVITKKTMLSEDKIAKDRDGALISLDDDERQSDRKIPVLSDSELQDADIIGVDPGRKTLYTSAFERPGKKHAIQTYSAGRWRHECGGNEAKRNREMWLRKRSAEYNAWFLGMPSTKVATVEGMQTHIRHLLLRLHECFQENGRMRVRKQRFTNYVLNQKALAAMVTEFITQTKRHGSTKKNLIVAFGDASFKTSGPVKKLKVELRRRSNVSVVDVDEFHTSLMMTCCAFKKDGEAKAMEREGPLTKQTDKNGDVSVKPLYGVSSCKNCTCYWDRDVNAAVNILRVFQHAQQHGGARHEFFSRRVATSSKQKRTATKRQNKSIAVEGGTRKKSKMTCAEQSKTLAPSMSASREDIGVGCQSSSLEE